VLVALVRNFGPFVGLFEILNDYTYLLDVFRNGMVYGFVFWEKKVVIVLLVFLKRVSRDRDEELGFVAVQIFFSFSSDICLLFIVEHIWTKMVLIIRV